MARRTAGIRTISVAAFVALSLMPAPAHALIVPDAAVKVRPITGGYQVCFTGDADPSVFVTGIWHVELDGWRSDNSIVGAGFPLVFTGRTLNVCANVPRGTAQRGVVVGTVTYLGVGIDLASTVEGYWVWSPETGGDRTGDGQTFSP